MKNYLIAGYYGMRNTGDDALQAVVCWGMSRGSTERILLTAPATESTPMTKMVSPIYSKKQYFRGENRLRGYLGALKSQGVVFGGGSVFHSSSYLRMANHWLGLAGAGPNVAIGVSIGPFRDMDAERQCAILLKKLHYIGLRDQESLEIANALAPNIHSEKTFDLAPLLPQTSQIDNDLISSQVKRKGIGFCLCDTYRFVSDDKKRDDQRRLNLCTSIEKMMENVDENEDIVFIDFNGHSHFGDMNIHSYVKNYLSARLINRTFRHISYQANPLIVLKTISNLRVIFGMRLHAAVFGYLAKTPTIILSYHPKCTGWAEQIGHNEKYVFDSENIDLDRLIIETHNILQGGYTPPKLTLEMATSFAMNNWRWINESL